MLCARPTELFVAFSTERLCCAAKPVQQYTSSVPDHTAASTTTSNNGADVCPLVAQVWYNSARRDFFSSVHLYLQSERTWKCGVGWQSYLWLLTGTYMRVATSRRRTTTGLPPCLDFSTLTRPIYMGDNSQEEFLVRQPPVE